MNTTGRCVCGGWFHFSIWEFTATTVGYVDLVVKVIDGSIIILRVSHVLVATSREAKVIAG
jgi:hypothetical protein